jgi:hypothetical protein
MTPYGWPEGVVATLRRITSMCEWDLDFIFAEPDPMPGLNEDVLSLWGSVTAPRRRRGIAGAESTPDKPGDTDWKFLRALHRLEAFDHGSRVTIGTVAKDWRERIGSADSKHVKKSVAKLKRLGLIDTAVGPNGGVWLTPKGRDLIAS